MGQGEIRIVLADRARAEDAYRSGLRHGLITTQVAPPPPQGTECDVLLELPFDDLRFPLKGRVVHSGTVATVIRITKLPPRLHEVLGGDSVDADRDSSSVFPAHRDTQVSPPVGGRSSSRTGSLSIGPGDEVNSEEEERWSVDGPRTVTLDDSLDDESAGDSLGTWSEDGADTRRPPDLSRSPSARIDPPKRHKRNYLAERLRQSAEDRRMSLEGVERSRDSMEGASLDGEPPSSGGSTPERVGATPPPIAMVREATGPGLPVPFKPSRFLPAVTKLEGAFEDTSAYEVFLRVYDAMLTGVGVLDLPGERYWVFFLNGKPVHYLRDPRLQSESIEALLIRKKLLSQPVLDWVRWLSEVTAQPIVSIVMRLGLITEGQMHSLRTTQVKMITRRVLDQSRGTYRLFEAPDIRKVFRNPAVTVTEMLWKRASFTYANLTEAQIEEHTEGMRDKAVSPTPLGESLLEQIPLTDDQRILVDRHLAANTPFLQLKRSVGELQTRDLIELLLCLQLMGLVAFSPIRRGKDLEVARLERKLREHHKGLDQDYFAFLDLHWSALPEEIEAACERLDEDLETISAAAAFIRDFDRIAAGLGTRLDEVRGMARDEQARRKYRARKVGEAERMMAAEMYLKQAEMALFRKEYPQADECFRRMLEIDPGGAGSRERRDRAKEALRALRAGRRPPPPPR